MKTKNRPKIRVAKIIPLLIILTITMYITIPDVIVKIEASSLNLTVQTDKQTYTLRQKVQINGTITLDGAPATDLLVNIQINDPLGIVAARTLQIGYPNQTWPINITSITLTDTGNNPINTAKLGSTVIAGATIKNLQMTSRTVFGVITIFDANTIPIAEYHFTDTLDPQQTSTSRFSFEIPKWATTGKALITCNVYSNEPKLAGIALTSESTMYYCLSKTQQGLIEYPPVPPTQPQNTPGKYEMYITLPPDPRPGAYSIYALAQKSPTTIYLTSTTFTVQNSTGYPPQPSFSFTPMKAYVNMSINLDASFSTPEGSGDKITRIEWDFGDGSPKVTVTGNPPNPFITHAYQQYGTFVVHLNVTDGEGLWGACSKPITIYPEFGPTANFTWTPTLPFDIDVVTFDASGSTPGWCANTQRFSPIQTYIWNFGDGTGNTTTTNTTVTHMFGKAGNYTVTLTVIDADGRQGFTSTIVEVLNSTGVKTYDVNGDGKIDLKDVYRVAKAYGSFPGHPKWDPACDFNKDDKVDLKDYYPVCKHYGEDP
jgi:PKD repeat protein